MGITTERYEAFLVPVMNPPSWSSLITMFRQFDCRSLPPYQEILPAIFLPALPRVPLPPGKSTATVPGSVSGGKDTPPPGDEAHRPGSLGEPPPAAVAGPGDARTSSRLLDSARALSWLPYQRQG